VVRAEALRRTGALGAAREAAMAALRGEESAAAHNEGGLISLALGAPLRAAAHFNAALR
jgi:hypothetical protein